MSKFQVFNIQLLPTGAMGEVGTRGYKNLLAGVRDMNAQHRRARTLDVYHYKIARDSFFGPNEFHVGRGFVYGTFLKYTTTNVVNDLNRRKIVFVNRSGTTTVSREQSIEYLFDAKRHYLAIEGGGALTPAVLLKALYQFIKPVAEKEFPEHQLHISLLSESTKIEEILESAVAFKTIRLDVTFANGSHETQAFLAEMKETQTQRLHVDASGGDGKMTRVPSFLAGMVRAAALVGSLQMTYYINGTPRKQSFDSEHAPLTFVVRRSAKDTDETYWERVRAALADETQKIEELAGVNHSDNGAPVDDDL